MSRKRWIGAANIRGGVLHPPKLDYPSRCTPSRSRSRVRGPARLRPGRCAFQFITWSRRGRLGPGFAGNSPGSDVLTADAYELCREQTTPGTTEQAWGRLEG